jgi:uncharacterized protein (TIGR02678 family)
VSLGDVLAGSAAEERRKAIRALLRRPLLTPAQPEYVLARRHAGYLADWFSRETGWSFHADLGVARLKKIPGRREDGSRPATAKGRPFSRRRYVLACLALAALERAESQVTLGWLADRVLALAQDDVLAELGFSYAMDTGEQRRDLAAVAQLLLEIGVVQRVAGDEEAFVSRSGDSLYDVDRRVLAVLLATRRGPSMVGEDREAIVAEVIGDTDDGRNRRLRHSLSRRLLDDPVVYYRELGEDERRYLDVQRGPLLKRLTEATGLVAEVRAEGIALLDPTRETSDYTMPDEGTDGHATLLLAELLSQRLRAEACLLPVAHAVDHMRELIERHRGLWRKNSEAAALTQQALHRLSALGLVELTSEHVRPLPALARYAYQPPKITRRSTP